jgi:hypothetical protein
MKDIKTYPGLVSKQTIKINTTLLHMNPLISSWAEWDTNVSCLLPLFPPGAPGRQVPQHYTLLQTSLHTPAFPRHSDYWAHLDSITSVITSLISVCSPALFPASALFVEHCACLVSCLFLIKCWLPVPASHLRHQSLHKCIFLGRGVVRHRKEVR